MGGDGGTQQEKQAHWVRKTLSDMVFFLFFFLLSFTFTFFVLLQRFLCVITVEMGSMMPTLQPRDRVVVLRHWPARWLRKGQIVVVCPLSEQLPPETAQTNPFGVIPCIKRVTGLPGDAMVTHLSELNSHHQQKLQSLHDADGQRVWQIPPGHFFVRGDRPGGDYDSLIWGPLSYSCLLAVMILKLPRKIALES